MLVSWQKRMTAWLLQCKWSARVTFLFKLDISIAWVPLMALNRVVRKCTPKKWRVLYLWTSQKFKSMYWNLVFDPITTTDCRTWKPMRLSDSQEDVSPSFAGIVDMFTCANWVINIRTCTDRQWDETCQPANFGQLTRSLVLRSPSWIWQQLMGDYGRSIFVKHHSLPWIAGKWDLYMWISYSPMDSSVSLTPHIQRWIFHHGLHQNGKQHARVPHEKFCAIMGFLSKNVLSCFDDLSVIDTVLPARIQSRIASPFSLRKHAQSMTGFESLAVKMKQSGKRSTQNGWSATPNR